MIYHLRTASNCLSLVAAFPFRRKDKSNVKLKRFTDAINEFMGFIFSAVKVFSTPLGNSILTLLDMFKTQEGRQQFFQHLKYVVRQDVPLAPMQRFNVFVLLERRAEDFPVCVSNPY